MPDLVECYSGTKYAERPLTFSWQGERLSITEILSAWRTPEGKGFRVQTQGGRVFELLFDEAKDEWHIAEPDYPR